MGEIKLKNGDCLKLMEQLEDKSVDMILCDLPYGTTQCKWDSVINFEELWKQYKRIIKDRGAIVLFGAEPFSSFLRMSNIKNYRYDWIWIKNQPTGFPFCKSQPLRDVELISVFYKKKPIYNPQGLIKLDKPYKRKRKETKDYIYNQDSLNNKEYLVEYKNYPKNTLYFKKDKDKLHPTQKPVALLEYLIKTYTNEGDLILDNTMGSGSTGVAAKNLNRRFIGMEKDLEYFKIAYNRITGYIYNE